MNDGALRCILDLLVEPEQSKDVIRDSLKLVKTLAGNDNVKRDVAESNGIPIVVKAMAAHIGSKAIAKWGCDALTAVCLRSPENSKQIMEAGGAVLITSVLRTHIDNASIVVRFFS